MCGTVLRAEIPQKEPGLGNQSPTIAEQYYNTHTKKRLQRTIKPKAGWKRGLPQKDLGTQKVYVKCMSTYRVLGRKWLELIQWH